MIWIAAVFFPLFVAAVCSMPGPGQAAGIRLMVLAPVPAIFLAISGDATQGIELGDFILKTSLGPDPMGSKFLLAISVTWFAAALFTVLGPVRSDLKSRPFCVMFLMTMCGNLGLAASRDAISFYAFFALMTFCAYSLVVHSRSGSARKAGRVYLIMAVLGEGLLVAGIMMAVFVSPGHHFSDIAPAMAMQPQSHPVFLLLFAGFGVKAGLIFLHFWLPLAHPVAPTPASAVLSAAMIKAGLLGWMNFFPAGLVSFGSWGMAFVLLGFGGAIFGAAAGLRENDPKTILAYSSISQMGLMTMCLGIGIMDQSMWTMAGPVLLLLVFNHAIAKSALFLGTAVAGSDRFSPGTYTLIILLLAVPAMALAGAPFTGGAHAKYLLKEVLAASSMSKAVVYFISASSVLTTMLVTHFLMKAASRNRTGHSTQLQTAAWVLMILFTACLPLFLAVLYPESRIVWLNLSLFLSSLWPVLAGLVIYLCFHEIIQRVVIVLAGWLPETAIIIDKLWQRLNTPAGQYDNQKASWAGMNLTRLTDQILQSQAAQRISLEIDIKLSAWTLFGMIFMLLAMSLAVLAWMGG